MISVLDGSGLNFQTTPAFQLTVQATDNGVPASTGSAVIQINVQHAVNAGPKLLIVTSPTKGTAGVAFSSNVVVDIVDANNNILANNSSTVTLFISGSGTITTTAQNGVATFPSNRLPVPFRAGIHTVVVSNGRDIPATSTIEVGLAAARKLVFVSIPSKGSANTRLTFPIAIAIEDAYGNFATADTSSITLNIATGPSGGSLSNLQTITVKVVSGLAIFTGIKFTKAGIYTLKAVNGVQAAFVSKAIVIS